MSYDIYLNHPRGCDRCDCDRDVEVGNMTSNVSPMWRKALGFPLADLHGRVAETCIADLTRAVAHMNDAANWAEYDRMAPDNGWGDRHSATRYLSKFLDACRNYPDATVEISR